MLQDAIPQGPERSHPKSQMREILVKNMVSLKKRRKTLLVSERSEDKECKTYVKKSFIYLVSPEVRIDNPIPRPDIYIRKCYNSKTRQETFSFRIKGYFYITKDQCFLKVNFCHSLRINILWKAKIFSPKSVPLT